MSLKTQIMGLGYKTNSWDCELRELSLPTEFLVVAVLRRVEDMDILHNQQKTLRIIMMMTMMLDRAWLWHTISSQIRGYTASKPKLLLGHVKCFSNKYILRQKWKVLWKQLKTAVFRTLPELTRKSSFRFHFRHNLMTLNLKKNKNVFRKYLLN